MFARCGNYNEHYYSIRYESRALGRNLDGRAGSTFRAGSDFLRQFFDFLCFSQHGHRAHLHGIGLFHFGLQFARQVVKLLDTFLNLFLIRLEDQLGIDFGRARVFILLLLGVLLALGANLCDGEQSEDPGRQSYRNSGS
jgi:hypothetical protein